MDKAPMGSIHYPLWLISTGGVFIDGFATFMTGVALPLLKAQSHSNPTIICSDLESSVNWDQIKWNYKF
jgi:hypothetical protein